MARPALVPALVFLAASLLVTRPELRLVLAALLPWLAWCSFRGRPFDRVLFLVALSVGFLHGGSGLLRDADSLGRAALDHPVDAPVERSWELTLSEAPKARDDGHWVLRSHSVQLEVPVRREGDRKSIAALRAGDGVRVWARARYRADTATFVGHVKSPLLIERVEGSAVTMGALLQRVRDRFVRRTWRIYGDDPGRAGFLAAVLFGDRSWRDPESERALRAAGLAHLLAISGLHVGVVAGLLIGLATRCTRNRWLLWLAITLALGAFGFAVGWGVPVRRAVAAAFVASAGRSVGRDGDPLNRLACIAVLLAWIVPDGVDGVSFALSFSATAGILLAGTAATGWRMSVAAYLATAPLCAAWFGQLAPWAALANLLAVPLVGVLLVAGYVSLAVADVPLIGFAATRVTAAAEQGISRIAVTIDALPASPWYVAAPGPGVTATLVFTAVAFLTLPRGATRRAVGAVFLMAIVVLHLGPAPSSSPAPALELLDVGQGQALVWLSKREVSLIDAAGRGYGRWDPGAAIVRPALLLAGRRRLDRLVLSHGDADHAAGAGALIAALEIGELWLPPGWWADPRLRLLAERARRRGVALRLVWAGVRVGDLVVVAPEREGALQPGNAGSLALVLGRAPHDVLVPGDRDGAALRRTLLRDRLGRVSALVLAHHGSDSGTPEDLLDRVRPGLAIVSCGWQNPFGHPRDEVVERLHARHIPLWRTDHHGVIRLRAAEAGWVVAISPRGEWGTR